MTGKPIQQVQDERSPEWMAVPGVVGTGIGELDGRPCIRVFVAEKTPDIEDRIPDQADGHPVVIEQTGQFRTLGP